MEYGATGNGLVKDTMAIRRTLLSIKNNCKQHNAKCILYFPKGSYLTGPFNLTDNLIVNISKECKIIASDDISDFPIIPPFISYGAFMINYRKAKRWGYK
jgi:polygalacturonase